MSTPRSSPKVSPQPQLLGLSVVAMMLGVSRNTVKTLVARGALPHVELPGVRRWLIDRADLERCLAAWRETGR
jgi:excisionase family DNA binding protein